MKWTTRDRRPECGRVIKDPGMKHGMNAGRSISKTLLRISICTVLLLGPALFLPAWLCGRDAESYFRGDVDRQRALARHVVSAIRVGVTESDFDTMIRNIIFLHGQKLKMHNFIWC